jgi:hypothetical protein
MRLGGPMAEQSADQTAVFQFMVLMGPEPPSAQAARRDLIRDDILAAAGRVDRELFAPDSTSKIGRLVYEVVFCSDNQPGFSEDFGYLLARLLPFLARYGAPCGDEELGTDLSLTGASAGIPSPSTAPGTSCPTG